MIVPFNSSTVPNRTLTDAQIIPLPSGDTRFSVTLTLLPVPSPYSPNDLVIISTIDPPDAGPIVESYPTSTQQYTVTFSGLSFGTTYTYNIRVALRNNDTITVGLPVTGSHEINGPGELLILLSSYLHSLSLTVPPFLHNERTGAWLQPLIIESHEYFNYCISLHGMFPNGFCKLITLYVCHNYPINLHA